MTDIHTLAGAYALYATDELERTRFERHLAECPSCAAEVAELSETMAALSDVTAEAPPPGLRAAVLARSAATPQAPRAGQRPAFRLAGLRSRRLVAAAATFIVLGGAGVAGYQIASHSAHSNGTQASAENKQIAAVLTAPDARLHSATATDGGHVTVVSSRSLDEAVAVIARLPSPGPNHTYQLWLISQGNPRSVGVLAAGSTAATELLSGVRGAQAIGVSREPAGGSATPTQPLVAQLSLT
ncbi:MAG TPA: anti-sigma factor [Streptosporangiaceae bacterium]|nr:anti-sigma factor [Streptosporangiaceae bacterium]